MLFPAVAAAIAVAVSGEQVAVNFENDDSMKRLS